LHYPPLLSWRRHHNRNFLERIASHAGFEKDSIRFNFKNWVFFNERLSMVGEDQAVMKREDERYQIKSVDVRFVYFDVGHAY